MLSRPDYPELLGDAWHTVAPESALAEPGAFVVADVDGESIVVVRGRDGLLRGFYNVCQHRGTAVTEETCGKAVRFQCPYHAWVYDLDGRLIRAKHTEDLDDLSVESRSLREVSVRIDGASVVVCLPGPTPEPSSATEPPFLTADELAAIRRPYRGASLPPGRAYHDAAIYEFERRDWWRRDWVCVGREEEAPEPGSTFRVPFDDDELVVSRWDDDILRAMTVHDPESPRVETWQGFVFISFDPSKPPLIEWLGDLAEHLERFDFSALRAAHRVEYDVAANWKLIAENYSECYHCPGVHPQLNRLTPYDLGGDFDTTGPWQGGWMELAGDAETMALHGGQRAGRPALAGMTEQDERRIVYYLVWPLTFLSLHPDYVLVHRLQPAGPGRTRIVCEWLFEPSTIARDDFDPTDAVEFWDLTNRQDWHVCELQQTGTASRSWHAGRYSNQEPSVHAFDLMVADRYAADGVLSHRTVRERYDVPPPKDGDYGAPAPIEMAARRRR
jgi:phenylpropionate dioxygenase-like ring-hydroxylating dioxygenase large terminal subunit